jgi:hypothetical protein
MKTRTLIVTLTADTEAGLESAENRIHDGLRWLHPHVPFTVERQQPGLEWYGISAGSTIITFGAGTAIKAR